jgi:DNA-binding NarL/FixJ family response regulator
LRILIADDHEVVRKGVRALLERCPEWEVGGEAATGRAAISDARKLKPDIILLDVSMPDLNGLEALPEILKVQPDAKVAMLTVHESAEVVGQAMSAGASGMVSKSDAAHDLIRAVEALSRQQRFISPRVVQSVVARRASSILARPLKDALTAPEQAVVQLLVEGKSSHEAAEALNITSGAVEVHRVSVMYKLKLQSVSDLFRVRA